MDSSDLVTVSSPEHHDVLVSKLWESFTKKQNVDYFFQWRGLSVVAHQLLLEAFLPAKKLALSSHLRKGSKAPSDDDQGNLESLVEFIYRGTVTVSRGRLDGLHKLAKEFSFKLMEDAVQNASKQPNQSDPTEQLCFGNAVDTAYEVHISQDYMMREIKIENDQSSPSEEAVVIATGSTECGGNGFRRKAKCGRGRKKNLAAPRDPVSPVVEGMDVFKCDACLQTFASEQFLLHHDCAPAKIHRCDLCSYETSYEKLYESHLSNHLPVVKIARLDLGVYSEAMENNAEVPDVSNEPAISDGSPNIKEAHPNRKEVTPKRKEATSKSKKVKPKSKEVILKRRPVDAKQTSLPSGQDRFSYTCDSIMEIASDAAPDPSPPAKRITPDPAAASRETQDQTFPSFTCCSCQEAFVSFGLLSLHACKKRGPPKVLLIPEDKAPGDENLSSLVLLFRCVGCGIAFPNKERMDRHVCPKRSRSRVVLDLTE